MSEPRTAMIINRFPQISETFIVRQAIGLDALVIAGNLNEKSYSYFDFDFANNAESLNSGIEKESFFTKLNNKLKGIPCKIWSEKDHLVFEQHLLKHNISVVLAQFGPNGINALPVCKKLGIPLIIQFLGYDASSLPRNAWYNKNIKRALEYASKAVVLYDGMEAPFLRLGIPKSKFEVINVGVPVEKFKPAKLVLDKSFNFLAVGRFVEKKSPMSTVKAFEICADHNPNVRLNIVGNGHLFDQVSKYVSNSLHKDKINLLGYLSQAELKPLYVNSHCFLQHSVTSPDGNTEGWPVGIAEACASGLPVISTLHAGIPSQVIPDETGFLVEEYDYHGMGKYMARLSSDLNLCKKMGEASRLHIEKSGNLKTQIKKLNDLINSQVI